MKVGCLSNDGLVINIYKGWRDLQDLVRNIGIGALRDVELDGHGTGQPFGILPEAIIGIVKIGDGTKTYLFEQDW